LEGELQKYSTAATARASSVREILEAVKKVSGVQIRIIETERRLGDPPALISDPQRIKELFAWRPTLQDIRLICETAYKWEKNYASRN